jgi:hypothetical protein
LQEDGESALGRSVDVVALPPAITRDGGDNGDTAALLLLEVVGAESQQRDNAQQIVVQLLQRLLDAQFALALVAQRAVRDQQPIESLQRLYRGVEHLLVPV